VPGLGEMVLWQLRDNHFKKFPNLHLQSAISKKACHFYTCNLTWRWAPGKYQCTTGTHTSSELQCGMKLQYLGSRNWQTRGQALRKLSVMCYAYRLIASDSNLQMLLCGRLMVNNISFQYPTATSSQPWSLLNLMEFSICSEHCKFLPCLHQP